MKKFNMVFFSIIIIISISVLSIYGFSELFSTNARGVELVTPESPVPNESIEQEKSVDISPKDEPENNPTFESPKHDAESAQKDAENEQAYRDSVEYVDNRVVFSVLDYRKAGDKAEYLTASSDICKKYELKDVTFVIETKPEAVEQKEGFTAYQVFYRATIKTDDVWSAADEIADNDKVMSAEPDYICETIAEDDQRLVTEDEILFSNWSNYGIGCQESWGSLSEETSPGEGVVVAIIDTGVDYNHVDLADNMWVNSGEIPENGVDDDGNGYKDDTHGINLIDSRRQGDPMDDNGHGTHVAGIVSMTPGNGGGVGIAYGSKIMSIKAGDGQGNFTSSNIAKAVQYAATNGADVINMSFGGTGKSAIEEAVLQDAFSSCVLVAAAGNDGEPTSDAIGHYKEPEDFYPAGYSFVIGVMASDGGSNLAGFSNWDYYNDCGCDYEICAPGVQLKSTIPNNRYASWSGTSMAAPVVSAAAAILRREYSDKSKYNSKFVMGQLLNGDKLTYIDNENVNHEYCKLDIQSALNSTAKPQIKVYDASIFDSENIDSANNGDGIIQAGETIDLGFMIKNKVGVAKDIRISAETEGAANQYIEFVENDIHLDREIGAFCTADSGFIYDNDLPVGVDNPIRLKISEDTPNDLDVIITVHISARNGMNEEDETIYTPETDYEYSFSVQNGSSLGGTIREDLTITNDKLWIIDRPVLIEEGAVVNVEPGTKIQFYSGAETDTFVYIKAKGKLNFNGTEGSPIQIFPNNHHSNYGVIVETLDNSNSVGTINMEYVKVTNPMLKITTANHCYFGKTDIFDYFVDWNFITNPPYGFQASCRVNADGTCEKCIFDDIWSNNGYGARYTIDGSVEECMFNHGNQSLESRSLITDSVVLGNGARDISKYNTIETLSCWSNNISNNAFLQSYSERNSISFTMKNLSEDVNASNNYWGTTNENLIRRMIYDNYNDPTLPSFIIDPVLSLESDLSSIYPFVTEIYVTDESGENRLDSVSGSQKIQVHVKFNRDMAQESKYKPQVSFGPTKPYKDYIVKGDWVSSREWVGEIFIDPFINQGIEFFRIDNAVADNDHWLRMGTDEARFSFDIRKSSAEALTLQGSGGSNCNYLSWIQDDYETLAGYNLYRSTSYDKNKDISKQNFRKINTTTIPNNDTEYTDSDVIQGQDYYYYFTVVDTDFNESEPSNVIKCTPIDEESPIIVTRAIGTKTVGEPVAVSADITDNVAVTDVTLFYKSESEEAWKQLKMRNTTGDTYQAAISGYDVKTGIMQYYITASDGTNISYAGSNDVPNVFSVIDVVDVESVSLDQTSVDLIIGNTTKLTASVYPDNATDKTVKWISLDESIATVDDGTVTAVGLGTTTIVAESANGSCAAICNITVDPILVTDLSLDPSETEVYVGDKFTITPDISPTDATIKDIEWESSDPGVASVSNTGEVIARGVGNATITARTTDSGKIEANCSVVVKPISVRSISLAQTSVNIDIGGEMELSASIYPDNATNKNITWESSDPSIVTVDEGRITAVRGGIATITATAEDGGAKAICNVIVNMIVATDITLSDQEISMNKGETKQIAVTRQPENASMDTYTWKSDDRDVAKVNDGTITAVGPGRTTIHCTTKDGSDITKICVVEVYEKQAKPDSPELAAKSLTTVTLKKVSGALYSNGGEEWVESNVFTDLEENTEYSFYIKMKQNGYLTESDPSEPIVVKTDENNVPITGLGIEPSEADMMVGDELQLSAVIEPADASSNGYEWSSSNTAVAEVDGNGKVTAKAIGKTHILCRTIDGTDKTAICTIGVYDRYTTPEMPDTVSITEKTIKIEAVDGLEYQIDGEEWNDSAVFSDLDADTEYTISVRKAASGYHKASDATSTTIRTLAHDWGEVEYAWNDDNTEVTATRSCKNSGCKETESETVAATIEIIKQPTCTAKGESKYTSDPFANEAFEVQTKTLEDMPALGHDWSEPEYEWNDDNTKVTATRTCGRDGCDEEETETVDVTKKITKNATCTTKGERTYTSDEFENEAFSIQEKVLKDIPALGHEWEEPEYAWNDDNTEVTATRSCGRSSCDEVESETADVTKKITKQATCTSRGETTYTATFDNELFATQTKTLKDIPALGHDWSEPEYAWNDDNTKVTATRSCGRDGCDEVETETVDVTKSITKKATCTSKGETTYTSAAFDNEAFSIQEKVLKDIPALGHEWGEPEYAWNDDNTEVTATRSCGRSSCNEVESETADVTKRITKQATCTSKGETTYTATFDNDMFATQAKTLKDIPALGHDWGEPEYAWNDDNTKVTATRTCGRDGCDEIETETADVTKVVTKAATCTEKGEITYTVAFGNDSFVTQSKTLKDVSALGHEWSEPSFAWNDDNTEVTATRSCGRSSCNEVESETADVTKRIMKQATCTSKGETTYTATFDNEQFAAQTKTLKDIPALGHDWSEPEYEWNDDNTEVTATRTCGRDGCDEEETETVDVTKKTTKKATCTAKGERTYTSDEFENEAFSIQKKVLKDIPALGHEWGEPEYAWNDDNTEVTATIFCGRSSCGETETETADVIKKVTKPATCTTKGETTYTADFDSELFTTQTKTFKNVPALGHEWDEPEYTWSDDNTEVTAARSCVHDGCDMTEVETVDVTKKITKKATCTNKGETTYISAAFDNEAFSIQEKVLKDVPALGHKWDAGKVTTQPTKDTAGIKTYTCTVCGTERTEEIPPIAAEEQMGADGTSLGQGASAEAADKAITAMKNDKDPKGTKYSKLKLKSTSQLNTSIKLAWIKISGAKKYVIYGNRCGLSYKMKRLKEVSVNATTIKKAGKALVKGKYYKFIVVALNSNNDVVSTSKVIHVATKGGSVCNHKSVTVSKTIVTKAKNLKKGKTLSLKAKANKSSASKTIKIHVPLRYETTNKTIATVSSKGVVKGIKKGSCYVYAYAQNGVAVKVRIIVK